MGYYGRMAPTPIDDAFTRALARELRIALDDAGMTRKALAGASGIPLRTMVRYLDAEREVPVSAFMSLCSAMNADAYAILDTADKSAKGQ